MLRTFFIGAACLITLSGCELLDEAPTDANGDDCSLNPTTCDAQSSAAQSVVLNVESSDDVFLVWVQSLPTGVAAADNYVTFTLEGLGSAETRALRVAGTSREGLRSGLTEQMRHEARRRTGIKALVSGMQEGTRAVVPMRRLFLASHPCAENEIMHEGNCVQSLQLHWGTTGTRTFDVYPYIEVAETRVLILVDQEDSQYANQAREAAQKFASTLTTEHTLLGLSGHVGNIDHNADGAVTLAFTNHTGGGISQSVVGFFDYRDMLAESDAEASGNNMDILWARPPTAVLPEQLTVATLAHEYSHLASFAKRVSGAGANASQEALWLDEGMAHLIEDLTGWGASNINAVEAALMDWPDTALTGPLDGMAQRGMAYLFLRHWVDQRGKSLGASQAASPEVIQAATVILGELLADGAAGFEHRSLANLTPLAQAEWVRGAFATGGSFLAHAHRSDFLPTAEAPTGNVTGIDPRGTYTNAAGERVPLDGPAVNDLDDLSFPYDGELMESGSTLFLITELSAGVHEILLQGGEGHNLQISAEQVE